MSVRDFRRMAGLEKIGQPAMQLRVSRIEKDSRQRDALLIAVTESCDPFSSPASTSVCLLNIATGRAASQKTQEYLTGSLVSGRKLHVKFQEECAAEEDRLMKPIQRRKVSNFAQENSKKRHPIAKGKPVAESLRDIFIRILVILIERKWNQYRNQYVFYA